MSDATTAITSTEGAERDWVFARRFAIRRMIERGDASAADDIPDIPEIGVLQHELEVLRWALQDACDDAWTDGEAAADGYLRKARTALESGRSATTEGA